MRDYREEHYGDFRQQREHPQQPRHVRQDWSRYPDNEARGQRYRAQNEQQGRYSGDRRSPMQSGDYRGSMEDYYNTTYDVNNYSGVPRHDEYGLPHGSENGLGRVSRGNPQFYNPDSFERTRYRYSTGHNPNYDNPEEGDLYRNFDSRGNHGYRHDAAYGNADEFRDFGDDRYGTAHRSDRY